MTNYRFYMNNREVLILEHRSDDYVHIKYLNTGALAWVRVSSLTRQEVAP